MRWNERNGTVTRAFDEWRMADGDIRRYIKLGTSVAKEAYDRIWEEASREPAWDDSPELVDVFHDRVEGVWPNDFQWMFLSGALKDGVTAYEVYLEKAFEEVLRWHDLSMSSRTDKLSLKWWEARDLYGHLGVDLDEDKHVDDVRKLRHILTHKRGELRTEDDRVKFGTDEHGWLALEVELEADTVIGHLDTLGASVRVIDPAVWEASWGRNPPEALLDYLSEVKSRL